ncbi:uncharacterized protein Tco025E_02150 [Trypanosoma conorhini]|uniref:Uncharacterized protein n=1 Tax=Trypanosoma conorhini TaxID=83891 RepID=A0A422Q6G0_9TRYP|nr:uncharacterized protein Tco025E_02150 [Trypanosoma conorhini]RNF25542.1 hypothetical protein Tco025E_02150 [Trypanosoma conorhini]
MILRSVGYKNMQIQQNEEVDVEFLFTNFLVNEFSKANCVIKDTLLWRIWCATFLELLPDRVNPLEDEILTAETLFMEAIKYSKCLISDLTRLINGGNTNMESTLSPTELHILCGGTSGEFAAICLFVALKSSLGLHFSSEPTTKSGVEFSAEVMSKLFKELIRFYTFIYPTSRHYHLLDVCQSLWQSSRKTRQRLTFTQVFTPQRQKRSPLVRQEDVFVNPTRTTAVFSSEEIEVQSKSFSSCVLGGLRSEEMVKKLIKCIQLQRRNMPILSGILGGTQVNFCEESVVSSARKTMPNSVWEENISTSWCTIELPEESGGDRSLLEKFLRNATDCLAKEKIDNAMSSLNSTNQSLSCFPPF